MTRWPAHPIERDRFVLARRPPRTPPDPWHPHGVLVESERGVDGQDVGVLTVFLTGRECPWRCAMCDLWQQTTLTDTPLGAIPQQLAEACAATTRQGATHLKLYNAGSFFDPRAVPEADYPAVARIAASFGRVTVESHPSLVGPRVDRFLDALGRATDGGGSGAQLEVAMGLETAHPLALERLHKRMDVATFERAARYLRERRVALRVFLLVWPPFIPVGEQDEWLRRSLDVAVAAGAGVISLIPTRMGNGTVEVLAEEGLFTPPPRDVAERSLQMALTYVGDRAQVFLDPWSAP